MRRLIPLVTAALLCLGLTGIAAPAQAGAPTPVALAAPARAAVLTAGQSLGLRVRALLATASATTVSAAVDVDGFGSVLRQDSTHALPPASTQKSFTSVAALIALPAGMRYSTQVAATATATIGILPGSLWLVGGGDPYLSRAGLRALAHSVLLAGITDVGGDVLLDDTRYDARRRAAGWKYSYVPDESGPLSALAVDGNHYRTDGAFVADPALPNAVLFRSYLTAEGITVHGLTRRDVRPPEAYPVATRFSKPLAEVLSRVLKDSDNFGAEMVLKEVGRAVMGEGSSAAGHAAVMQVLAGQGVGAGFGTDGSGLSAYDRQTTAAQIALLHAADQNVAAGVPFRAALPVACQDGTLKRRMCGTYAAGRLAAKTGSLPGIRALSGYTTTMSGRTVWFSFQLTGVRDALAARRAIDRAAVLLSSATL